MQHSQDPAWSLLHPSGCWEHGEKRGADPGSWAQGWWGAHFGPAMLGMRIELVLAKMSYLCPQDD